MPRDGRATARAPFLRSIADLEDDAEALGLEELESLTLLDGGPSTPAIRALPAPKPQRSPATEALYARARVLWPGLDARALSRCNGDPHRVARLVARRTVLTEDAIISLLLRR